MEDIILTVESAHEILADKAVCADGKASSQVPPMFGTFWYLSPNKLNAQVKPEIWSPKKFADYGTGGLFMPRQSKGESS